MSKSTKNNINFYILLTTILVAFKITNYTDWDWIWVVSPLWIPIALIVVGVSAFFAVALLKTIVTAILDLIRKR